MNTDFIKNFRKFYKNILKLNQYIFDYEEKQEIKNKLLKSFLGKYDESIESISLILEEEYKILNEKGKKLTAIEKEILVIYGIIKNEF